MRFSDVPATRQITLSQLFSHTSLPRYLGAIISLPRCSRRIRRGPSIVSGMRAAGYRQTFPLKLIRVGNGFRRPRSPNRACRFSRTRVSRRWFPHRDWLASFQAAVIVNSPSATKKVLRQRPLSSLDAVIQRRQHALVPHRCFHPPINPGLV